MYYLDILLTYFVNIYNSLFLFHGIVIGNSSYCVIYYDENYMPPRRKNGRRDLFDYQPKSGTAVAHDYAVKKGKSIMNLYTNESG